MVVLRHYCREEAKTKLLEVRLMGKTDYHARGEKDGAAGKYNPPVGAISMLFSGTKEDVQHNTEYDAGYKNARKQKS